MTPRPLSTAGFTVTPAAAAAGAAAAAAAAGVTAGGGKQPPPPAFGTKFTPRMIVAEWTADGGWGVPRLEPLAALPVHPASPCLHYGLQVFEGLKAYRSPSGEIALFRPWENVRRMGRACRRLALPAPDKEALLALLCELVAQEALFVPHARGESLYVRPLLIGTSPVLGVAPATAATLLILACPVGPYFASGARPVAVCVETDHLRAWPGGVGRFKIGGNYAPTMLPQLRARAVGCAQVLWTLPAPPEGAPSAAAAVAAASSPPLAADAEVWDSGKTAGVELEEAALAPAAAPGATAKPAAAGEGGSFAPGGAQSATRSGSPGSEGPVAAATAPPRDWLVTEAGTMNVFAVLRGSDGRQRLVTPPLDSGLILPGVTRSSLLQLARDLLPELEVREEPLLLKRDILGSGAAGTAGDGLAEPVTACAAPPAARLCELFGSGTACLVCPIDEVVFEGKSYPLPLGDEIGAATDGIGPVAKKLRDALMDIQQNADRRNPHPWNCFVEEHRILRRNATCREDARDEMENNAAMARETTAAAPAAASLAAAAKNVH